MKRTEFFICLLAVVTLYGSTAYSNTISQNTSVQTATEKRSTSTNHEKWFGEMSTLYHFLDGCRGGMEDTLQAQCIPDATIPHQIGMAFLRFAWITGLQTLYAKGLSISNEARNNSIVTSSLAYFLGSRLSKTVTRVALASQCNMAFHLPEEFISRPSAPA